MITIFLSLFTVTLPAICSAFLYLLSEKTSFKEFPYWLKQLIFGLCFFGIAVLSSFYGFPINGTSIPVRDATIVIAGQLFGGLAGIIAAVCTAVFYLLVAPEPYITLAATLNVIFISLNCAVFRKYMFDNKKPSWPYALGFGIVSEVMFMLLIFITHFSDVQNAFAYVSRYGQAIVLINGFAAMLASITITVLCKERVFRRGHGKQISTQFQRWLLVCVGIALIFSSVFTIALQNSISTVKVNNLLELNLNDVYKDISDTADENLLSQTRRLANRINTIYEYDDSATISSETLQQFADEYDVTEINIIDDTGIVAASTDASIIGFDMNSNRQSQEFLDILSSPNVSEFTQSYQPTAINPNISRKYAAVELAQGGFIQIGYDAEDFHNDINSIVQRVTQNRHINKSGGIIILNENLEIISARDDYIGQTINRENLPENITENEVFETSIYGTSSYCMYESTEGYYILVYLPVTEANFERDFAVNVMIFMEILIFAGLFLRIYFLIKGLVVDNIQKVTNTLGQITDGNLDVSVNVRTSEEFASLSDDINTTVDTLKAYIDAAVARIDKELEFAQIIQHSVLPTTFFDESPDIALFADMRAAKEVGGDFYDFYFVSQNAIVFLIADVSGKGIPAAMFMMQAKALIKGYAESGMDVDEILTHANAKLCEGNDADMFVTAWIGKLDLNTGNITFANAGHNPPLVRHGDGSFEFLKSRPGFVLAGLDTIQYTKNSLILTPGDIIYLYTDGVTEATDATNALYGNDRLLQVLNATANESPRIICKTVQQDIDTFVNETPQFDDITMLCLKYLGGNYHG